MKNARLKLWSLLIACCIALFVNSQTNAGVVTFVVPVELLNLPINKVILIPASGQAQVKLRGPSFLLSSLGASPPTFRMRVPENAGNSFTLRLQEASLDLPPSVEVQSIDPPEIEYILDDVVQREVNVEVPRIGQLAEHLRLERISITPQLVSISGPETEVKSIKRLETFPLDMREVSKSMTRALELRNPGKFTKLGVPEITVNISVISRQIERKFIDLPIEIRSTSGESFVALPAMASIEVSGAKRPVNGLRKGDVVPYVKIENGSATEKLTAKVLVDLPDGVSLVSMRPEKVKLKRLTTSEVLEPEEPESAKP